MKIEDLLKMKVSLYRRVNTNKSVATISLDDYLHKLTPASRNTITELRKINQVEPKTAKIFKSEQLPCVTISGVFEGERKISDVTEQNPVICIDIDEKPEHQSWNEVKQKVFKLPYVFYVSLSARGEGIFALVYYNMDNSFLGTFNSLEKDFKDIGITIDRACKDICRLRFVSYDEFALEKTGDIEMYNKVRKEEPPQPKPVNYTHTDITDEIGFVMKTVYYLINNCGYRADNYNDWLLDGFRLATLGDRGYPLFMYLSQMSSGWTGENDAVIKWNNCKRNTIMTKECLYHYYRIAKESLGKDWRRIVQDS